jgi:hypothetical protein
MRQNGKGHAGAIRVKATVALNRRQFSQVKQIPVITAVAMNPSPTMANLAANLAGLIFLGNAS